MNLGWLFLKKLKVKHEINKKPHHGLAGLIFSSP